MTNKGIIKAANSRRGHKLLTQKLLERFKYLGKQDHPQAIVIAKYFHPLSQWTWYATHYDEAEEMFFGLVTGFENELGYFSLHDINGLVNGIPFERDLYWNEVMLKDLQLELERIKRSEMTMFL